MPDNVFDDDVEEAGANVYIEVLKAAIGGLNLLVDTLMGNSVDGVETTPEEQRQAWEDGKDAGRQRADAAAPVEQLNIACLIAGYGGRQDGKRARRGAVDGSGGVTFPRRIRRWKSGAGRAQRCDHWRDRVREGRCGVSSR